MQLRFVPSESTDSYFEALDGYLKTHGCPVAFYSDKHTVFRVNKPDAEGLTRLALERPEVRLQTEVSAGRTQPVREMVV